MTTPVFNLRLVYLASPYSSKLWNVRRKRYREVRRIAAALICKQLFVYSPVTHGHVIDEVCKTKQPPHFWMGHCFEVLKRCDVLFVAMLEGWRESVGVMQEIALAKEHEIPVYYLDPDTLDLTHEA